MDIVWEDPPETMRDRATNNANPRIDAMREHPGKWLLWGRALSPANHTHLKNRYGPRGFEFVTRLHRIEENRRVCDVYSRFIGNEP